MTTLDVCARRTVNDALPGMTSGEGIFSALAALDAPPAWIAGIDAADLDLEFAVQYGSRFAGALLRYFDEGEGLTAEQVSRVAGIILARHGVQWDHLYELQIAEYDPIENYNSTDTETYNNRTHGKTGTVTDNRQPAETVTRSVYGVNSPTPVPSDQTVSSGSSTLTTTYNTSDTDTGSVTRTRRGNIGVTTTAQMIEGEIALWRWDFIKGIMETVAADISTTIY